MNQLPAYPSDDLDRIIEMAWEDRTTFEAIRAQFGLSPGEVIVLMRHELSPGGFRRWRKRTAGRSTKHEQKRISETERFRSTRQRTISGNRISKRP
jgi:uncharacterized protein (TIGR03643 family)